MTNNDNGFSDRLRAFVKRHPEGWSHHEWLELLAELSDTGVETRDPERIGSALERERVLSVLEATPVKGLGPKRRVALADRFGTLWSLKQASVDDVAALPSFHRAFAEALLDAIR